MKWINFTEKSKLVLSMATSRLINSFRNPSLLTYSNILCIKDDEIGDMCYSLHVFEMLRKQYPEAKITLLCKSYCLPLVSADPAFNSIITKWDDANERYDLIVDLKVSWKSLRKALTIWPKARLDRGTVRFTDAFQHLYPHEAETNFKVVAPVISALNQSKIPVMTIRLEEQLQAEQFISKNNLHQFALFHISARRELRKWPLENYLYIAEYLHKEKNLDIVFVGGPDEKADVNNAISKLTFKAFSSAGQLSLAALAGLMKSAALFIGNESGPLHIAAIMKLPCIGLYGPGPQIVFYPIGEKSKFIHHVLPCNPCDQIHCIHPELPCIKRITVEEVKSKIAELYI